MFFNFTRPTEQTEQLFADSLRATIADYEVHVRNVQADFPEVDLDTGRPTQPGEYRYCDLTYAQLLHKLVRTHFATMTPELRSNVLGFYRESDNDTVRRQHLRWRHVMRDLEQLKATSPTNTR